MKKISLIVSLGFALFALPVVAQQNVGSAPTQEAKGAQGPHAQHEQRGPFDCSKAKDVERCKMHQNAMHEAREACAGKDRKEREQCMHEQAMNIDCGKERDPQRCEAHKQAAAACKSQSGEQFRQCVEQKMPAVDCSKMPDPARCEQHQKVRDLCKDKTGAEHRQCLHENLVPKK